ncbi:MAG: hypothetical protein ACTHMO_00985 [Rhodanobacteraceae bacterium]
MPSRTPPPRRPRPVLFWIIAAIVIAAIIMAWIYWANDLGRGTNPNTNVPMTPGYAPATTTGGPPPSVPAGNATRPAPATQPNAMSNSTALPPPGSTGTPTSPANAANGAIPHAAPPPKSGSTAPASGGTH